MLFFLLGAYRAEILQLPPAFRISKSCAPKWLLGCRKGRCIPRKKGSNCRPSAESGETGTAGTGWTPADVCSLCITGFQFGGGGYWTENPKVNHRIPLCRKGFCLSTATDREKPSDSKLRMCPAALLTRTSQRQLVWHSTNITS